MSGLLSFVRSIAWCLFLQYADDRALAQSFAKQLSAMMESSVEFGHCVRRHAGGEGGVANIPAVPLR